MPPYLPGVIPWMLEIKMSMLWPWASRFSPWRKKKKTYLRTVLYDMCWKGETENVLRGLRREPRICSCKGQKEATESPQIDVTADSQAVGTLYSSVLFLNLYPRSHKAREGDFTVSRGGWRIPGRKLSPSGYQPPQWGPLFGEGPHNPPLPELGKCDM